MSVRTYILSKIAQLLTSEARVVRNRASAERKRRTHSRPHVIEYFHQVDDPYSHLMAQALRELVQCYDVKIIPYLVTPPTKEAAPELEQLNAYALTDAARLATRAGIGFTANGKFPNRTEIAKAQSALVWAIDEGRFFENVLSVGSALWMGECLPNAITPSKNMLAMGDARRAKLGHYLGATVFYAGEWYWGLDRLHYLEERLCDLGAFVGKEKPHQIYPSSIATDCECTKRNSKTMEIDFFFSFRSPYSYISFQRTCDLADAYDAQLNLRFVLPMIMRGLPVPRTKRFYILHDTAREARRLDIPFGCISDPLGDPVKRGYSLLPWAIDQGKGREYCQSFMHAVWSEGVDAKSDKGLRRIVQAAGLPWDQASEKLGNGDWKPIEEDNRAALKQLNLWGVPSYCVGEVAVWGQDRLWAVEEALKSTCEKHQD